MVEQNIVAIVTHRQPYDLDSSLVKCKQRVEATQVVAVVKRFPELVINNKPIVALWVAVAAGQSVQYVGRVQQSPIIAGAVQFEWSSVEIHTTFKGRAIDALLDREGNVFEVFVDGFSYTAASGLSSGVVLRKRTEARFGVVTFRGLVVAGGCAAGRRTLLHPCSRGDTREGPVKNVVDKEKAKGVNITFIDSAEPVIKAAMGW
ncbi:uncharacterized protein ACA1_391130 [Acanthamoeba castellanii str. Neff]|uniref:Carbohydrate esterase 2 N-terminal domain-containing protein n=1 Tax=Acanthamoeba castellanii (strain ATCC 30010 / Neff) TaxID=1257118 RepID=L8GP52_ACACF|nr:uncharacterized protein ACA1_391130 [Acanthamoeba castellanii str. Neff]ELR14755.1 hypothetical protein ACA1_391130 [Acanthamoeba castellanii str. Neff]